MVNTPAFDAKDPGSSPTNKIQIHNTYGFIWGMILCLSAFFYVLMSLFGRTRTYRVASLHAGSYNM